MANLTWETEMTLRVTPGRVYAWEIFPYLNMRGSAIQDIGYWLGLLNSWMWSFSESLSGLNAIVPPLASLQWLRKQEQEIAKSQGVGRGLYWLPSLMSECVMGFDFSHKNNWSVKQYQIKQIGYKYTEDRDVWKWITQEIGFTSF